MKSVIPAVEEKRKELIKKVRSFNPRADIKLLKKAIDYAVEKHGNQLRKSGDLFVTHPIETALICADLKLDTETIAAAVLHDVVEDCGVSMDEVTEEFGSEIASLIDGVTKLEKIKFKGEEGQAENFRKMLVAMAKDIRVVLIKLADRLHNMRTIEYLRPEKQKEKARETLEIYAPLAHRLGIYSMKAELEDIAFSILEPKKYEQIKKMVADTQSSREEYIRGIISVLDRELKRVGIKAEITGRAKHYYSIYQKMKKKGKEFSEIYDLDAIRIITKTLKDCYGALGIVHSLWKPLPGKFKDYIAVPKFNMYQSLHTTVIGPQGKPLEIQIRTEEMHRIAEYGIAAHWAYKEGMKEPDEFDKQLSWLRQILEIDTEYKDPRDFMKALKIDLLGDEVFVFTPKGDVISLPRGATPIDFAYAIHTEIGHRCVGAIVNGKIVPLDYELQSGDQVKILTSTKTEGPSRDWLNIVRTSRARSKIRAWFSKEAREDSIAKGKEEFVKVLRKHGLFGSITLDSPELKELAKEFNQKSLDDLYGSIGTGNISPKQVVTRLVKKLAEKSENVTGETELIKEPVEEPGEEESRGKAVIVKGVDDILVRFARCCNPVPGDDIAGYITRGRGVSVHRKDCPNFKELSKNKEYLVDVSWSGKPSGTYKVEIQVEAVDRTHLMRDITAVLSDAGVNIVSATLKTTKEGLAIFRFVFEIGNVGILNRILKNIREIDNVFDAYRV